MDTDLLKKANLLKTKIECLSQIDEIFTKKEWFRIGHNYFNSAHFSLLMHYGEDAKEICLPEEMYGDILRLIRDYEKKFKDEFEQL